MIDAPTTYPAVIAQALADFDVHGAIAATHENDAQLFRMLAARREAAQALREAENDLATAEAAIILRGLPGKNETERKADLTDQLHHTPEWATYERQKAQLARVDTDLDIAMHREKAGRARLGVIQGFLQALGR